MRLHSRVGSHLRGDAVGLFARVVEGADVHERGFRQVVAFTFTELIEGFDRLGQRGGDADVSGEDLRDVKRLAEEALDLAGPGHGQLVVFGELVHAEDGDDVLQIAVALKDHLHPAGHAVVVFTGFQGIYTPLEETIDSFDRLCEGDGDDLPESAFMYVGSLDDGRAKAVRLAAEV